VHTVAGPSPARRHATLEYGTANAAQPVDWTVADTPSAPVSGADKAKEHGGAGGGGAAWATPAPNAPAPAPNATAHAARATAGLTIAQS